MTAFEILLNKFYDIIEKNEPSSVTQETNQNHSELNTVIKKFIDTSFFHGGNLSYKNAISDLLSTAESSLKKVSHEEWARIKFFFRENDLHIIRRDRAKHEVKNLRLILVSTLPP